MRQDLTDISIVLDCSGSMADLRNDTIGGFNSFLEAQKAQPGDALLTLMQFNTVLKFSYEGRRLATIEPLSQLSYTTNGGTALLDAIGRTITETGRRLRAMREEDRPGKVIFVIMTDGEENASREFSHAKITAMIKEQRDVYAWEFVFLGANQDAIRAGTSMGVAAGSTITYANSARGTASAFVSVSNLASHYRSAPMGASGQAMFTSADYAEQEVAGVDPALNAAAPALTKVTTAVATPKSSTPSA